MSGCPQHHGHSSSAGIIWLLSRTAERSQSWLALYPTPPSFCPSRRVHICNLMAWKVFPRSAYLGTWLLLRAWFWQTPLLSPHLSYTSPRPEAASGCCHQIPDRSHLREERFILVSSLRGFHPLRKGRHSSREHASGTPRNRDETGSGSTL